MEVRCWNCDESIDEEGAKFFMRLMVNPEGPEMDSIPMDLFDEIYARTISIYQLQQATAEAWFNAYEDKGLSGYSPEADVFYSSISYAVSSGKFMVIDASYSDGDKIVPAYAELRDPGDVGMPIQLFISTRFGMPLHVADHLVKAETKRSIYRRIERNGLGKMEIDDYVRDAVKYGALRRLTQGSPMVDVVEARSDFGADALFTVARMLDIKCVNPILDNCLQQGIDIHNEIMDEHCKSVNVQNGTVQQ